MGARKRDILVMGVNILAGQTTGGMLYTAKVYDFLSKQPDWQVEPVELSGLREWIRFRLISLYLLWKHRKHYDYIIIDGTVFYFLYLMHAKARGSRIVCLCYHLISREQRSFRRVITEIKERILIGLVDKFVFISQSTLKDAVAVGYEMGDYALVEPGLDKEIWADRTKEYAASSEKFNIIFVGHIVKRKGVMDLVLAFEKFLKSVDGQNSPNNIQLQIIGNERVDPPFVSDLRQYIKSHGLLDNVHIAGWLRHDEVVEYYRNAAVFVHPSHYEGYGIVVMEAASFGLPLIVSDSGALPEVVRRGEYGLIFKTGNIGSLVEKFDALYHNHQLRSTMSRRAATLYHNSKTWDDVGRETLECLTVDE